MPSSGVTVLKGPLIASVILVPVTEVNESVMDVSPTVDIPLVSKSLAASIARLDVCMVNESVTISDAETAGMLVEAVISGSDSDSATDEGELTMVSVDKEESDEVKKSDGASIAGTPPMEEAVVTASESLMAVWETDSKLMDEAGTCERESVVNKTASVAGVCVDGPADTTDVAVTSVVKTAVGVAINIDVAVDEGRALTGCDASVGSAVTVAVLKMPGVGMAADVVMIVDSVDDGARLTEDDSVRGVEGSVLNDAVDASTTNNDEEGATVKKSVVDASAAKAVVSVSVENTRVEPPAVVASAENDTEDASVENSVESSLVST